MRIIRYLDPQGRVNYGSQQADGSAHRLEGELFHDLKDTGQMAEVATLLAPIKPSALLCVGLNYRTHAKEVGAAIPAFPILFLKSPGALQNPGGPIELPRFLKSDEVDYEGEMAVVIGKTCKNVSRAKALDYVLGYTCANDVSARDWQTQFGGTQWSRGKSFDTFCPLGPWLVTADEVPDPQTLRIRTLINGQVFQDSHTSDMIFDVASLIEFLSGSTTLEAGTVILTGTPQGVGAARTPKRWLVPGDSVSVEIEKLGVLTNPVVEERARP